MRLPGEQESAREVNTEDSLEAFGGLFDRRKVRTADARIVDQRVQPAKLFLELLEGTPTDVLFAGDVATERRVTGAEFAGTAFGVAGIDIDQRHLIAGFREGLGGRPTDAIGHPRSERNRLLPVHSRFPVRVFNVAKL